MPKQPSTEPIDDVQEAFMHLYRTVGRMRGEYYRTELSPALCVKNAEGIGSIAQKRTTDLFHKLKGD